MHGTIVYLNRWILNQSQHNRQIVVDHINHNTLDNRKENMRITYIANNNRNKNGRNKNNKSGYRNVFWDSSKSKWSVHLCKDYHNIHVGDYDDVDEAGKAAEEARQKYYGEFAGVDERDIYSDMIEEKL